MKNVALTLSLLVSSVTSQTAMAAVFDLSPRMTSERAAASKQFGASIDNTSWVVDCGKGQFKFSFNSNGSIVLNEAWDGYTWAVTDARSITMTAKDGGRAYFIFDTDLKSVQFISWQNENCTGKKS